MICPISKDYHQEILLGSMIKLLDQAKRDQTWIIWIGLGWTWMYLDSTKYKASPLFGFYIAFNQIIGCDTSTHNTIISIDFI